MRKLSNGKVAALMIASSLLVTACGSLIDFGNDGPPPRLYSIQSNVSGELATEGPVIYISEPLLPGEADGTQIAVSTGDFELSHLQGGRWAEPFRSMLHRHIESDLGSTVKAQIVGAGALDIKAACRLAINFQRFDYSVDSGAIVAQATVRLSTLSNGDLAASKVIAVSAGVADDSSDEIVAGFNQAADTISTQLSTWLNGTLHVCADAG